MSVTGLPGHHSRQQHVNNAFRRDKHPPCYKPLERNQRFQEDVQPYRTLKKGDQVDRSNQIAIERGLAKSRLSNILRGGGVLRKERREYTRFSGKGEARNLSSIFLGIFLRKSRSEERIKSSGI